MPEQSSTLTIKYGGETMEKESRLQIKNNLVITSLDGEGIVFEVDTRKVFWVNDTATFLLKLLEANSKGVPLSSAKSLLQEHYLPEDGSEIAQDFTAFVSQLERFGLVSLQSAPNGAKIKNPDGDITKPYLKPIIKEEIRVLSITGATVRAARMAANAAAAVARAAASGFKG